MRRWGLQQGIDADETHHYCRNNHDPPERLVHGVTRPSSLENYQEPVDEYSQRTSVTESAGLGGGPSGIEPRTDGLKVSSAMKARALSEGCRSSRFSNRVVILNAAARDPNGTDYLARAVLDRNPAGEGY